MPARLTITLPDEIMEDINRNKPRSLSTAAFCALLIDRGLDNNPAPPLQPPVRGADKSASSSPLPLPEISKPLDVSGGGGPGGGDIAPALEQHRDLILDFWRIKKGSKGKTAWSLLMGELEKIRAKYGHPVVKEQLELAVNGKWQGIRLATYEQFKAPAGNTPAQPEFKHPAAREFRGGKFVDEESTAGGVLEGLF